ncbi:MAG: type II toxin-antitoxin system RelE family toxin [Candidatus Bathyarchaeia archaeon]
MTFTLLLHPKAAQALKKIGESTRTRIIERLRELGENPEKAGKPLKHSDFWSLRIGDYRVIYEIDRDKNQVVILFVGHRKRVYDDFSKMF